MPDGTLETPVVEAGEEWRRIDGFPGYEISSRGRVRRTLRSNKHRGEIRVRKWAYSTAGYPHVGLAIKSRMHTRTIHRLVAAAFIGPRPAGMHINHKNGIKDDPRVENLEYCTPSENTRHAYENGFIEHPKGSAWYSSKLNEAKVMEMRRRRAAGELLKDLAVSFGVCMSVTCEICSGKAWMHVQ